MQVKIRYKELIYFIEPVEDNPRGSNGDSTPYFMYRIMDEDNSVVGCLTFNWTRTARAVAGVLPFESPPEEEMAYLAILPYLPIFPETIEVLYKNRSYTCFHYVFGTDDEGLSQNKFEYNLKLEGGFLKTAQKLIFGGSPTDDQVRRQILTTLYNYWLDDPHTYMVFKLVNIFVPVERKILTRNTLYLLDDGMTEAIMAHADPPTIQTVRIKNKGIKHIEDQSEFSIKLPSELVYKEIVMGNKITASTTGSNSPIVIDSQNISLVFNEIEMEVERSNLDNKEQVIGLLHQLNKELVTDRDHNRVVDLLKNLKNRASWVNQKVLSNPIIAQILAQIFIKSADLS